MKDGCICYDFDLIKNSISEARKQQIFSAVDSVDSQLSNRDILQAIKEAVNSIFSIDDIFFGDDYIDYEIINKIGINNKMLYQNNRYHTYAACHHCYGKVKKIPGKYIVSAHCYRIENEYNEYRKKDFDMFEIVSFDTDENLAILGWELIFMIYSILEKSNIIDFQIIAANDSFMTEDKEKLLYQMLSKSKIEIVVYSEKYKKNIAVASINFHRKNFISKFELTDDVSINSMCFGIGIDRLKNIVAEYE